MVLDHLRDPGDTASRKCTNRTSRDGVDANATWSKIAGKIANRGLECRLGDTHHIIVRNDALCAKIGQCNDRPAVGHQWQRGTRERDQRIGADVERRREPLACRRYKLTRQLFTRRIRDRMDQKIDRSQLRLHVPDKSGNLFVTADIAWKEARSLDFGYQLLDVALQPIVLVTEGNLCPLPDCRLGNRPGDTVLVGHANDQSFFSFKQHVVRSSLPELFSKLKAASNHEDTMNRPVCRCSGVPHLHGNRLLS